MQPNDTRLRDELHTVAEQAGPLTVTAESLVARVKRRRRRSVAGAAAGVVVVMLGATSAVWLGAGSDHGGQTPAASPSYPRPFVCGETLDLGPDASDTRHGLTMTLSKARKLGDNTGPELALTFTSDRPMNVHMSPTRLFEVLYVRDGIIVGGGPMLNEAGDLTPQGLSLPGSGFDVDPENPWTEDPGQRNRLCSGLTWPAVWAEPQSVEVVVVQGNVLPRTNPNEILIDIPTLGYWPLFVARAHLAE